MKISCMRERVVGGGVGQISGGPCHVMLGLGYSRASAGAEQKPGQELRQI